MLDFIMMTLSFVVGILLATGLAFVVMLNPKVMKWYMKAVVKYMKDMEKIAEDLMVEDL